MRKRNVAILFRLNKKEAEALDKKVKKSGLNREAYLRQLISGVVPKDAPPPDYYSMMRELHKIGNNLNQIAQKAHVLNVVDVQRYDQEVQKFNEAVRKITEAVILPEKNESWQCESCQKYCPASEECMATDENVRCTKCEYLCETCGICELKE